MNINPHKSGLALGSVVGGLHLVWSLLVLVGWAQPLINFIYWAHMVVPPIQIAPFSLTAAILLIIITAVIGYIVGRVFGMVWNKVNRG
jgi:hypothetical protein